MLQKHITFLSFAKLFSKTEKTSSHFLIKNKKLSFSKRFYFNLNKYYNEKCIDIQYFNFENYFFFKKASKTKNSSHFAASY
jgi:hypothetical protein